MLYVLICLAFLLALCIFYMILSFIFIRPKLIQRVTVFTDPVNTNAEVLQNINRNSKKYMLPITKMIEIFGKGISSINFMTRLKNNHQKELIKAGIPLKGEEFIVIQLMMSALFIVLTYRLTNSFFISFCFSFLGFIVSKYIVTFKKNKRIKKFNDQLGDTIVLLSNSLKVGHSFVQSVATASQEMPEPISKEFGKFLHEIRLGVTTEDAFKNFLDRVESDDLELLITAVNIQRQTGGNLADILDTISKTIRERIKIKGEIKTLTAQGRLSGIIVALLPFALAGVISIIDPEYVRPLYTSKIGILLLSIAIVNETIGYLIIKKIVKIEF